MTRMEPASHFTNCQYVVNDYQAEPVLEIQPDMARLMMRDIENRPPEFIVDGWRRSWTMAANQNPWIYNLDRYPEFDFTLYLRSHYRPVGTFDDCDLWVRRPGP